MSRYEHELAGDRLQETRHLALVGAFVKLGSSKPTENVFSGASVNPDQGLVSEESSPPLR